MPLPGGTGRFSAFCSQKKRFLGHFHDKVPVPNGKREAQYLNWGLVTRSLSQGHNGTSRLHNQRKVRKTLAFSKVTRYHRWMSWLAVGLYNFGQAHSSLKIQDKVRVVHRSPAMAAKLADHIWSTWEWLRCPILGG